MKIVHVYLFTITVLLSVICASVVSMASKPAMATNDCYRPLYTNVNISHIGGKKVPYGIIQVQGIR